MKIKISYFYQIRFFKENMIPLSTAAWDPKWYHDFKCKNYWFKDANNVFNGLRIESLMPQEGGCPCEAKTPPECPFMRAYREQLNKLNFADVVAYCEKVGNRAKELQGFSEEPVVVLIVYEKPDNPCSERVILKQWFAEHGYELEDWEK